jgi:Fe-S cluster biosynthesis and repair protein YggX
VSKVECQRCAESKPALPRAPFKNDIGQRVLSHICQDCWKEWLTHQTVLINHYGLDPRDSKSREFLYEQIQAVLLGEGDAKSVDTAQKGEIQW